jgi:hypothetical protein
MHMMADAVESAPGLPVPHIANASCIGPMEHSASVAT